MEQVLEHDPGHVRTRAHYEAMLREQQQLVAAATKVPAVVSEFRAQQDRVKEAISLGTRIVTTRMPL